jgi:hypothetical protein
VKKALVVLLVVLVVVTGLPILMSMSGMATCRDCGPATLVASCALAILAAGVALHLALLTQRLRRERGALHSLLRVFALERPPQYLA